jgi:hypothetical protein
MEAAQAVDAVELYLNSVQRQLHPYLVGYFGALFTVRGTLHRVQVATLLGSALLILKES